MKRFFSILSLAVITLLALGCQKEEATTGALRGMIEDCEGITVTLVGIAPTTGSFSAVTAADGFYLIRDIPAGDYAIECSKNGVKLDVEPEESSIKEMKVTIRAGKEHLFNIYYEEPYYDEDDE